MRLCYTMAASLMASMIWSPHVSDMRRKTPPQLAPLSVTRAPKAAGAATAPDRYLSADEMTAAVTRLELGVMRAQEAMASWGVELHKHVGGGQLSWGEAALLHSVRLRGASPTLAELLTFLHRKDLAALQYSLRKLEKHGLVKRTKGPSRREVGFAITEAGRKLTDEYARVRREVFVTLCEEIVDMQSSLVGASAVLERVIGIYDQATQSILNQRLTTPPEDQ